MVSYKMGDKLPLLPEKDGAVCADVRPVLHEIFRDVYCLPPLTREPYKKEDEAHNSDNVSSAKTYKWINDISSEYEKINEHEVKLQKDYAARISKDALPNIYQLHSPRSCYDETWKDEIGLLRRKDLKPSVEQNTNCEDSLWVKNVLNRNSGEVMVTSRKDSPLLPNILLKPTDDVSSQSMSIGEIRYKPPPPLLQPLHCLHDTLSNDIICIPSKIDFVNFNIGERHTKSLRLVNKSKFEVRLSIRPPSRRELDVELCSRLVVTSGSSAEMKIHYRPKDVRALTDELLVRVSSGQMLNIPIACYLEPPFLEIFNKTSSNINLFETKGATSDILDLGAKLLGDLHPVQLFFQCKQQHSSFFLLSEDSWNNFKVEILLCQEENTELYCVTSGSFCISPSAWSGGVCIPGLAVCRSNTCGLHSAAFRVISSTGIVRSLTLVADTLMFSSKHIILLAHEKDYDIYREDDPLCEYYINLGIAYPNRELSATINIINNSSLYYNYFWTKRAWGIKQCKDEGYSDLEAKIKIEEGLECKQLITNGILVTLEALSGLLSPRSTRAVTVRVPNVGMQIGMQRTVMMLILKDIPKESLTPECHSRIVNTIIRKEASIAGILPKISHEFCEVVCAQIEVCWEVIPVRFTLDPAFVRLSHSRRVKSLPIQLRAIQLNNVTSVSANWEILGSVSPIELKPKQAELKTVLVPLNGLPRESPYIDVFRIISKEPECFTSNYIEQYCDTRHPSIQPAFIWLGHVVPGALVTAEVVVRNDTHEKIEWSATCYRWYCERGVEEICKDQPLCSFCHNLACICSLLSPTRGVLEHSRQTVLNYKVFAPDSDGCVVTLIQVRRSDYASACTGMSGRTTVIAYRVQTPCLVLRVLLCHGNKIEDCETCTLDMGLDCASGSCLVRCAALTIGDRICYRLMFINVTPLTTSVVWEHGIDEDDILKVKFLPNYLEVPGNSEIEITALLEAKKICNRRLFVQRANVEHSHKPLYLLIDAAVSGLEVIVEFPTENNKERASSASIKLIQKEHARDNLPPKLISDKEIFTDYNQKKQLQKDNLCSCSYEMLYSYIHSKTISKVSTKESEKSPHIEIIEKPPAVRVCPCCSQSQIPRDLQPPCCLQFKQLPLRSVRTLTVKLRNVSRVDAHWRATMRRWPRRHARTIQKEQWSADVHASGVVLQCAPARALLRAGDDVALHVSVYADTWGLYHDQILIQFDNLEPLIVDVWIEAVGPTLEFALRPTELQLLCTLWMSSSDLQRKVLVKNTTRSDINVYAYVVKENEYQQDVLPFRLYLRLHNFISRTCSCGAEYIDDTSICSMTSCEDARTGMEVFLAADHGVQDSEYYRVEPLECLVKTGENNSFKIHLLRKHELAPDALLVLQSFATETAGDGWYRPPPPLQFVQLRQAQRTSCLQASCSELKVTTCVLNLPEEDVVRIGKNFKVLNVGDGPLKCAAQTKAPWRVERARHECDTHCLVKERVKEYESINLYLPPRNSTEMKIEVSVKMNEVCPESSEPAVRRIMRTNALRFYDNNQVLLLTIPLILDIDCPVLKVQPEIIDFGDVSESSTRKSYFTVNNSSPFATLELVTIWIGCEEFHLWPSTLSLRAGTNARIYIQYTARWSSEGRAGGRAVVSCLRARRCAATVHVTARPQRCTARAPLNLDHTDDVHLLPPDIFDV